jgi:AcrR family transcriptional regulator
MPRTRTPRPGRRRSETARRAVLDAALAMLRRDGFAGVTMEALAAEAGVGKQTVYRWWKTRAAVVLEALRELPDAAPPFAPTGSLRRDLERFARATLRAIDALPGGAGLLRALIAEAQGDPATRRDVLGYLLDGRRTALLGLFARAAAQDELRGGFDAELGADLLFGAIWYRTLAGERALEEGAAEELARTIARAARR